MTRPLYSEASGVFTGLQFHEQDFLVKGLLLDAATAPLTDVAVVGGDPDALSARIRDWFVDGDFVAGQAIRFVYPAAANAGAMTIAIQPVDATGTAVGGALTKSLLTAKGDALVADQLMAGLVVEAVYEDGAFNITSAIFGVSEASRFHWQFTASGTWTKPLGLSAQTPVWMLVRAAGGGGQQSAGGGGGAAKLRVRSLGDLSATESVVIGAGGVGVATVSGATAGGNSSFGAHVVAIGGAAATNAGGAGGGLFGQRPAPDGADTQILRDARNLWEGGNGAPSINGGRGVYGGGGGVGTSATGGASDFSGAGGNNLQAGTAPSGGGGARANGARGQVDVWI